MELNGRKSFWAFQDDDPIRRGTPSPSHSDSEPSRTSFTLSPRPSISSSSPWRLLSPPHRTHGAPRSPSLLYHCVASLYRQEGAVQALALVDRGRLVLTGSDSDRVRAWRQPDLADSGLLRTRRPRVRALHAHADAIFTAHGDRRVRVWSLSPSSATVRWRKVATLPPRGLRATLFRRRKDRVQHRDEVSCLALYIVGGILYTGSWDRTVKAWRVGDGTCTDSFVAHEGRVNAVAVGQEDGGTLFSAGADGCIKVWRRVYGESTHALTMVLRFQASPVNALVVCDGEGYVYSGSSDGYVNIWEREAVTGRYHHGGFLQGHRYAVLCLAAVEKVVLSGSEDTTIRVWRREEGSGFHVCLAVMEGHRGPVRCIGVGVEMVVESEFGGMGLLVFSASLDRVLKAWRLKVVLGEEKERRNKELDDAVTVAASEEEEDAAVGCRMERKEGEEYEMSPVLSPLWVEKRMRQSHLD